MHLSGILHVVIYHVSLKAWAYTKEVQVTHEIIHGVPQESVT